MNTCVRKVSPPGITETYLSPKPALLRTFVMGHNHLQLLYISLFISILFLILLWIYGPFKTIQSSTQYYQATSKIPVQLKVIPAGQIAPQGQRLSLVAVTGTKTVLVAAYQEHRTERKEVRVIAVVLRSEKVAYRCILRCQEKQHISSGVINIHSDHFNFAYGTADIMCPLPSGCETPSHIAVTSDAAFSEDKHTNHTFLEVKNRKAQSDSFPYDFTVCISTMFDFTNVLQLVQSLEMLKLLGVNRVVVYKTSSSPETQSILDYYTNKGFVEVIPWSLSKFVNVSRGWLPEHGPGDIHYLGQIPALNDCVYRYMYQSRYVALHDMDELILPQSVNSWSELLPLLEKQYGADRCYMFENNVFPITVTQRPPNSQPLPPQGCCPGWHNVSGVNILAHLYHEPIISETHSSNFKIIVNPRAVFVATVHGLQSSQNGCSWVDRNIARMYHTRAPRQTKLTPDQLIYDGQLLSYSARLIPNVNTVFKESFKKQ